MRSASIISLSIGGFVFLLACLGFFNSIIEANELNISVWELNYPEPSPNYKLPKTWVMKVNNQNEYILECSEDANLPSFKTYLKLYTGGSAFILGVWTTASTGDAKKFKDTSILKTYAHILYDKKMRGSFKPISK